jgi:hypothetical protein
VGETAGMLNRYIPSQQTAKLVLRRLTLITGIRYTISDNTLIDMTFDPDKLYTIS